MTTKDHSLATVRGHLPGAVVDREELEYTNVKFLRRGGWEDDVRHRAPKVATAFHAIKSSASRISRRKVKATPFPEENGNVPFNASGVTQVGPRRFVLIDNHDSASTSPACQRLSSRAGAVPASVSQLCAEGRHSATHAARHRIGWN